MYSTRKWATTDLPQDKRLNCTRKIYCDSLNGWTIQYILILLWIDLETFEHATCLHWNLCMRMCVWVCVFVSDSSLPSIRIEINSIYLFALCVRFVLCDTNFPKRLRIRRMPSTISRISIESIFILCHAMPFHGTDHSHSYFAFEGLGGLTFYLCIHDNCIRNHLDIA